MHKRLYDFLEINNVIDPLQFDFRKKHSATHAGLTEKVNKLLMMEIMVVVFLLISRKLLIL